MLTSENVDRGLPISKYGMMNQKIGTYESNGSSQRLLAYQGVMRKADGQDDIRSHGSIFVSDLVDAKVASAPLTAEDPI